jgi:hypothetical protein
MQEPGKAEAIVIQTLKAHFSGTKIKFSPPGQNPLLFFVSPLYLLVLIYLYPTPSRIDGVA